MGLAEAMRLAASRGCECSWDAAEQVYVIAPVSYDSDACSLTAARLAGISREEFLALYIPDRP